MELVKAGDTDQSVYFYVQDATTGGAYTTTGSETNWNLIYTRKGAAQVSNNCTAALAAVDGAHEDNKIKHVGVGQWRADFPDAAFAAGVAAVELMLTEDSGLIIPAIKHVALDGQVDLVAVEGDQQSVTDLKDFADTGYDPSTHLAQADMARISADATAADNLETMLDGTGGQKLTLEQLVINSATAAGAIDIDNSAGAAINAESSLQGGSAIWAKGTNATQGRGATIVGSGSGAAARFIADGSGQGIYASSASGWGFQCNGDTGDIDADIAGSVSGAVGSVAGNVDGSVASVAAGGITATSIANAAIDNATFAADVGSTVYASNVIALAVRKALDELNLDHLMKTAVANNADMTAEVVDGTVISNIMSATSDTSTYVVATDSLEGLATDDEAGAGAVTSTFTVKDGDGVAIQGAEVWICDDAAGSNVLYGTLNTNTSGVVTFNIDVVDGLFVHVHKTGYNFTAYPKEFNVVAAGFEWA